MSNIKAVAAPILIIALGVGWLLTTQHVLPGVNWIWVLGLGMTGVLVLAAGGIDKVTVLVGPFLIAASFFSILRQTARISVDTEAPLLVIVFGTLMLIARLLPVRVPAWLVEPSKKSQ